MIEKIQLDTLGIIQDELRNPAQLPAMIEFVNKDGQFEELIEIAHFPDDKYYIHNGHHRCVALYLSNTSWLMPNQFFIKEWKYEDYNTINFDNGYITPFDVKTESRLADIGPFKKRVAQMLSEPSPLREWIRLLHRGANIVDYIYANPQEYKRKKLYCNIQALAIKYYYLSQDIRNVSIRQFDYHKGISSNIKNPINFDEMYHIPPEIYSQVISGFKYE